MKRALSVSRNESSGWRCRWRRNSTGVMVKRLIAITLPYSELEYVAGDLADVVRASHRVEMDDRHSGRFELLGLVYRPFYPDLAGRLCVLAAGPDGLHQLFGQADAEGAGQDLQVLGRRDRLDARDDRYRDARFAAALHEIEVLAVVEEHLGHDVVGSRIDLLLEVLEVALGVRRLEMLFGIARHAYRELGVVALLDFAVDEFSPVHGLDLAHQVGGVGVSLGVGDEAGFVLPLVAPQCQHVVQSQEIHVDQRILDVVFRPAAADQVGNHLHVVFAPDRGRDADRARTAAHDVPLAASVGADVLFEGFAVEGDVDVGRVEIHQRVDGKSDWQYLWKVLVPLAMPSLVTIFILKLMGSWNAYVWPNLVAGGNDQFKLVSNGLRDSFQTGTNFDEYGRQMAATVLVTVPLLLLFVFFRKYIMRGVSRAGIKG